jgi:formate dehydrogenase formation protein
MRTVTISPWAAHRRRGQELRVRHSHAAEVLTLYLALVDVWEDAWRSALADPPHPSDLARWAAERVLPRVVTATVQSGPPPLAAVVLGIGPAEPILAGWLAGAESPPVERYLARAVLRGPLEAVDAAAACGRDPAPRGGRHCPSCGGQPQLSYRTDTDDNLVSGRRYLVCGRCGGIWGYSGSTCASCGETTGAQRTVYTEHHGGPVVGRGDGNGNGNGAARFPHLRIEACGSCSRYLIDVDVGRDTRAVPEVDELAALPLDLFAAERGLRKIAPNLMGF